jgi:hypothetical protein
MIACHRPSIRPVSEFFKWFGLKPKKKWVDSYQTDCGAGGGADNK